MGTKFSSTGFHITLLALLMVLTISGGCSRNRPSERPPIHFNPNMDNQEKYRAQSENRFFEDGAAMRVPVAGTVARDDLQEDDAYFKGLNSSGEFIDYIPIPVNIQGLERGRERFDIFCSPCHSRLGDGRGIMIKRGYPPPPTFHSDRIRKMSIGEIYNVITNGVRNMPSYRHQVPVGDRWAIIAYLRALQRSQQAGLEDIPPEMRDKIGEVK
jgi:hypothetical protein